MGSREFEFDPDAVCDGCGKKGAFDIYGDYYCEECLKPKKKPKKKEKSEEGHACNCGDESYGGDQQPTGVPPTETT